MAELSYVQVVSFLVSFAGFTPTAADDRLALAALADVPCPESPSAVVLKAAAVTAHAHAAAMRAEVRLIRLSHLSLPLHGATV